MKYALLVISLFCIGAAYSAFRFGYPAVGKTGLVYAGVFLAVYFISFFPKKIRM